MLDGSTLQQQLVERFQLVVICRVKCFSKTPINRGERMWDII